jgi:CheY-like chemotaxis protein
VAGAISYVSAKDLRFLNCRMNKHKWGDGSMFKLLVVEDDRELNRSVCSFLNQNSYDALGCLSANEAYDAMYGGTVFDLIISDIMMPEIDGFEFARTIREPTRISPSSS